MVKNREQATPRRYILFIEGRCDCGGLPLQFISPVSGKVISRAIEWCSFQLNFHKNLDLESKISITLRLIEENSRRIPEIPDGTSTFCGNLWSNNCSESNRTQKKVDRSSAEAE